MKEIKLNGLDQSVYFKKLQNGLEIYFIPIENKNSYEMQYITKFGSRNNEFIPIGEDDYLKVPDGIAHFLEHKMFETEDGEDPFTFASKTGTNANACTSYDSTRYYFEGSAGFKENLDYLITYVNTPYFTDHNVEKEKGIIGEEIKQYDDEIVWALDEEMRKCFFKNDPYRIDIAGSIESISKITPELLYRTYNTYYEPSNMFIIISGKFDMNEALSVIENNESLNKRKSNYEIIEKEIVEPVEVNKTSYEFTFNIVNPKVSYAVKIPIKDVEDKYKFNLYLNLLSSLRFGNSSEFKERLKSMELFTSFYCGKELYSDYIMFGFDAETDKPMELIEEFEKEIKNLKITEEELERQKKVWISSQVYTSDNIDAILETVVSDILYYNRVIDDRIDIIRSLNINEFNEVISSIDFNNKTHVIVNPK